MFKQHFYVLFLHQQLMITFAILCWLYFIVLQSLSIGIHDEKQRNGYSNPVGRKSIEHYQF
jgi:hypothetical protein